MGVAVPFVKVRHDREHNVLLNRVDLRLRSHESLCESREVIRQVVLNINKVILLDQE